MFLKIHEAMHNEYGFHLIINKKESTKTYSLLINLFNIKNIVKLNSCSNFHFNNISCIYLAALNNFFSF